MSRQKGILPFFRLSRFGGLMHFSYFCLIKNVIHENFIPCETIYQSPYFSWHLLFLLYGSSHDGMELMDARYRWYGFTKEVIAGYVLEGIFILLYS